MQELLGPLLTYFPGDKPGPLGAGAPASSCLPLTLLSTSLSQASSTCQAHFHPEALSQQAWRDTSSQALQTHAEPVQVLHDHVIHETPASAHIYFPLTYSYWMILEPRPTWMLPQDNFKPGVSLFKLTQLRRCTEGLVSPIPQPLRQEGTL